MLLIDFKTAIDGCSAYKQMGDKLVVIHNDIAKVYDIYDYDNYSPKTLFDSTCHFTVTSENTWRDIENRIFGVPTMPNFNNVFNN